MSVKFDGGTKRRQGINTKPTKTVPVNPTGSNGNREGQDYPWVAIEDREPDDTIILLFADDTEDNDNAYFIGAWDGGKAWDSSIREYRHCTHFMEFKSVLK